MNTQPLWIPSEETIAHSNMLALQQAVNNSFGIKLSNYNELHQWSVDNTEAFWKLLSEQHPVVFKNKPEHYFVKGNHPTESKWFVGATLNFAENLITPVLDLNEALIGYTETMERRSISGKELYLRVAQVAQYLKDKGIQKGDRVAGIVCNTIETVVAMLATTSLGAVWSSCSPEFGESGILDRFTQIDPKLLFVSNSYMYGGKPHQILQKINAVRKAIPGIIDCVDISDTSSEMLTMETIYERYKNHTTISYIAVSFDSPLYIMYSSGTTGKPKCIMHSVGGTLLQHVKEHRYHVNMNKGEKIMWYTTCGWMMWNWLVSGLASGATVILYEGSVVYPNISVLFNIVDKEDVHVMGLSPKYLSLCEKEGVEPIKTHTFKKLKSILSTGSPLPEQGFKYVYNKVKKDVHLASVSGGTDIIACFFSGNITLPVYEGELQCKALAMDVRVSDSNGNAVVNEKGELTCNNAFPSIPIGFWNDPEKKKFLSTYYSTYPDKWCQGDIVEEIAHSNGVNGYVIYGRSDTVLNPGGVRIGTAEIYRHLEAIPDILESVVVGFVNKEKDVDVILFVVLKNGITLTDDFKTLINTTIRKGASPRHVPKMIFQVKDTPKTLSGKIAEKVVMNTLNGYASTNIETLANAACLGEYNEIKKRYFL